MMRNRLRPSSPSPSAPRFRLGQLAIATLSNPRVAGRGADTVTPALIEQFIPFIWLTTPNRYLMLMQNLSQLRVRRC